MSYAPALIPRNIKINDPPLATLRKRSNSNPFLNSWDYGSIELENWERKKVINVNDEMVDEDEIFKNLAINTQSIKVARASTRDVYAFIIQAPRYDKPLPPVPQRKSVEVPIVEVDVPVLKVDSEMTSSVSDDKLWNKKAKKRNSKKSRKLHKNYTALFQSNEDKPIKVEDNNRRTTDRKRKLKKNKTTLEQDKLNQVRQRLLSTPRPILNNIKSLKQIIYETENDQRIISGCGTDVLINILIDPGQNEDFIQILILTHHRWISTVVLLQELLARYGSGKVTTEVMMERFILWLELQILDFIQEEDTTQMFWNFVDCFGEDYKQEIRSIYDIEVEKWELADNMISVARSTVDSPKILLPKKIQKSMKNFDLMDIPVVELARQLSLRNHQYFQAIPLVELLSKKYDDSTASPHICDFVAQFNFISNWVVTEILSTGNLKMRRKVLGYFLQLAVNLLLTRDYFGLMAIFSALTITPITRLAETWKGISSKKVEQWEKIQTLCSPLSNFKNLRDNTHHIVVPCVQTPTLFLRDITFLEEDNDYIKIENDERLISVSKLRNLGKILLKIHHAQSSPYNFIPVPKLQQFLQTRIVLEDEDLFYGLSKNLEPPNYL